MLLVLVEEGLRLAEGFVSIESALFFSFVTLLLFAFIFVSLMIP